MKALRGAQYARDANRYFELRDVRQLTNGFDGDERLKSWTTELHRLINSPDRLQYPTEHSSMNIPHNVITQDICQTARSLCSSVVYWCQAFINNQH